MKSFLSVNACKFTTTYVNAKFILSICMYVPTPEAKNPIGMQFHRSE